MYTIVTWHFAQTCLDGDGDKSDLIRATDCFCAGILGRLHGDRSRRRPVIEWIWVCYVAKHGSYLMVIMTDQVCYRGELLNVYMVRCLREVQRRSSCGYGPLLVGASWVRDFRNQVVR